MNKQRVNDICIFGFGLILQMFKENIQILIKEEKQIIIRLIEAINEIIMKIIQ